MRADIQEFLDNGGSIDYLAPGGSAVNRVEAREGGVVAQALEQAPELGTLLSNSDIFSAIVPVHLQIRMGSRWQI